MKKSFILKLSAFLTVILMATHLLACCTEFESEEVSATYWKAVPKSWKGSCHIKDKEARGEGAVLQDYKAAGLRFLGHSKVEGNKGVDLIFWDNKTKTLVFHESKFEWAGEFNPNKNKKMCPQGTTEWIAENLNKMKVSKYKETRKTAKSLKRIARYVEHAYRTANVLSGEGLNGYHAIANLGDKRVMGRAIKYVKSLVDRMRVPSIHYIEAARKTHRVGGKYKACPVGKEKKVIDITKALGRMRIRS